MENNHIQTSDISFVLKYALNYKNKLVQRTRYDSQIFKIILIKVPAFQEIIINVHLL